MTKKFRNDHTVRKNGNFSQFVQILKEWNFKNLLWWQLLDQFWFLLPEKHMKNCLHQLVFRTKNLQESLDVFLEIPGSDFDPAKSWFWWNFLSNICFIFVLFLRRRKYFDFVINLKFVLDENRLICLLKRPKWHWKSLVTLIMQQKQVCNFGAFLDKNFQQFNSKSQKIRQNLDLISPKFVF